MMPNPTPITASIATKINHAKRVAILCAGHSTPSSVISWGKSQTVLFMAATRVTAATEGCTGCHHDKNLGDLLGAISYTMPLERFVE
ncbi:MAG: hypothetical protein NUV86_09680 [Candidatus Scalindua sp.]|nr:hypothetical protein [Candidatus Scalindua sp.]MCR4343405.1 hypothetical protein [Candidatus Scalindua sp.]